MTEVYPFQNIYEDPQEEQVSVFTSEGVAISEGVISAAQLLSLAEGWLNASHSKGWPVVDSRGLENDRDHLVDRISRAIKGT